MITFHGIGYTFKHFRVIRHLIPYVCSFSDNKSIVEILFKNYFLFVSEDVVEDIDYFSTHFKYFILKMCGFIL